MKSWYILYVFTYILRLNVGCLTLSLPTWFIYLPVFRAGSLTEPGAHSFQSISFANPRDTSLSASPALEFYMQAAVLSFMWVLGIQILVLKPTWQAPHRLSHLSSALLYYDVYMETVPQQRRNLGLILNETSEWEVEICRQITKDRVRKTFRHPKVGSFSILSNVNETGDGLKTIQNLADLLHCAKIALSFTLCISVSHQMFWG